MSRKRDTHSHNISVGEGTRDEELEGRATRLKDFPYNEMKILAIDCFGPSTINSQIHHLSRDWWSWESGSLLISQTKIILNKSPAPEIKEEEEEVVAYQEAPSRRRKTKTIRCSRGMNRSRDLWLMATQWSTQWANLSAIVSVRHRWVESSPCSGKQTSALYLSQLIPLSLVSTNLYILVYGNRAKVVCQGGGG